MEGDAGSGQLNPTDSAASPGPEASAEAPAPTPDVVDVPDADAAPADPAHSPQRHPSRLGRGRLVGIAAALTVLAVAVAAGGYGAQRAHRDSVAAERADVDAVAAAKDCLIALHARDPATMDASQRKIIDCATGDFTAQAPLLSSLLAEAYAGSDIHVQMLDLRAAVERHHRDRSVDVLAALRLYVSSTNQEVNYRLRVLMAPDDGQYKVAKIDQVLQ